MQGVKKQDLKDSKHNFRPPLLFLVKWPNWKCVLARLLPCAQPSCAGDQTTGALRAFISSRCSEQLSGQKETQKPYLLVHLRSFIHVVIVTITAAFTVSEPFQCQVLCKGAPTDLVFLKMKRLSNSWTQRLNITKTIFIRIFKDFKCPEHNIYLSLVTRNERFVNNFFSYSVCLLLVQSLRSTFKGHS